MDREKLLDIIYREHKTYPFLTQREFDCLEALVEDGTIATLEELREYGFGEEAK